jgi:hypothetical protein
VFLHPLSWVRSPRLQVEAPHFQFMHPARFLYFSFLPATWSSHTAQISLAVSANSTLIIVGLRHSVLVAALSAEPMLMRADHVLSAG